MCVTSQGCCRTSPNKPGWGSEATRTQARHPERLCTQCMQAPPLPPHTPYTATRALPPNSATALNTLKTGKSQTIPPGRQVTSVRTGHLPNDQPHNFPEAFLCLLETPKSLEELDHENHGDGPHDEAIRPCAAPPPHTLTFYHPKCCTDEKSEVQSGPVTQQCCGEPDPLHPCLSAHHIPNVVQSCSVLPRKEVANAQGPRPLIPQCQDQCPEATWAVWPPGPVPQWAFESCQQG